MPSDERVNLALQATAGQREAFQTALSATVDQVEGFLAQRGATGANGRAQRLGAELGPFAAGRIDMDRIAGLFTETERLDGHTLETVEKARDTLKELAKRPADLYRANVAAGGNLYKTVATALEEIGRAFGAVRIFELTRSGSYRGTEHARSLGSFPFDKWSKGERRLAPPLVVSVDGADLKAGLSDFMDGGQKIVLVVRGACAPAPLVRLITPGTFVQQATDAASLAAFAGYDGPGVAALVPEGCALFAHDPTNGETPAARLTITYVPERPPRLTIGGKTGSQQAEEVRQLEALATAAAPSAAVVADAAPAAVPPSDPVDKLAAWLLSQADLSNLA